MAHTMAFKILRDHLVEGTLKQGTEIGIRIDQTLTQDATGTMAYLQFEALGLQKVKTELSVSYIDHNTLQSGFENADDHRFLQTAAARFGVWFSRPGNGICHQVHLERFGAPGKTLLGSDSHTPTAGGLGMLGIGAGGLDVAVAMGGGLFYLTVPAVIKVNLTGKLQPWVGAKDIILNLLSLLTVKGGVGKIIEYGGEGAASLTVPERATITNMGAELGATSSLFPSDEQTRIFLQTQLRDKVWSPLAADEDAVYDEEITINLNQLEPLAAAPHSPDAVKPIADLQEVEVDQVAVGSCTNGSYADIRLVAETLKNKVIHPRLSLVVAPGSRQVYMNLAREGYIEKLLASGARILESACGPCIGMGQAPPSGGVSVRTFNRNFSGRSGTADAGVYLTGPAAAAASALKGKLTDPRLLGEFPILPAEPSPAIDDRMLIAPPEEGSEIEIVRGPNIKPLPINEELADNLKLQVLLVAGDHITTDHIMPGGSKVLPLRSNIEALSEYVFAPLDPDFAQRALKAGGGIVVAGDNYGQGSSREHAALAPMYLGVKAVIAKSFARIHRANLINFGILPLQFEDKADYETIKTGDYIMLHNLLNQLENDLVELFIENSGISVKLRHGLTSRQKAILIAGGLLNYTRNQN